MVQKDRMVDMIKNGLFLCSIGSLIVLYSLNPHSQRYDLYSMVTGLFLTGLGIYFFMKGKKEKKQRRKITNGNHKKLNIPASFFYDKVMDSVLFDVRKATGKSVTRKQLKNLEYVKQFSQNNRARIKIEEVIENQSYKFRTSTTKNEFVVHYQIKPVDDSTCEIHYTEKMESYGMLQKLNDMLLGTILMYFKRRRFKKMLEMIEATY